MINFKGLSWDWYNFTLKSSWDYFNFSYSVWFVKLVDSVASPTFLLFSKNYLFFSFLLFLQDSIRQYIYCFMHFFVIFQEFILTEHNNSTYVIQQEQINHKLCIILHRVILNRLDRCRYISNMKCSRFVEIGKRKRNYKILK